MGWKCICSYWTHSRPVWGIIRQSGGCSLTSHPSSHFALKWLRSRSRGEEWGYQGPGGGDGRSLQVVLGSALGSLWKPFVVGVGPAFVLDQVDKLSLTVLGV